MKSTFQLGMAGLVGIGMATALVLPGRQTANIAVKGGNAVSGIFGTVISGKAVRQ